MKFRKVIIPLVIGIISAFVACGEASEPKQTQNNETKEVVEIETASQEVDSAKAELDKETSDLEKSLEELNSEN